MFKSVDIINTVISIVGFVSSVVCLMTARIFSYKEITYKVEKKDKKSVLVYFWNSGKEVIHDNDMYEKVQIVLNSSSYNQSVNCSFGKKGFCSISPKGNNIQVTFPFLEYRQTVLVKFDYAGNLDDIRLAGHIIGGRPFVQFIKHGMLTNKYIVGPGSKDEKTLRCLPSFIRIIIYWLIVIFGAILALLSVFSKYKYRLFSYILAIILIISGFAFMKMDAKDYDVPKEV